MSDHQSGIDQGASDMSDRIIAAQESIKKDIAALLDLPLEAKREKNESIKSMIAYYAEETKAIEDRRNRLAEFAWQSLAITVTASAVVIALSISVFVKGLLLIILGAIIITHILKLFEYQSQSSFRYPFLEFPEFGNKWKWLSNGSPYLASMKTNPFTWRRSVREDQLNYLQGLEKLVAEYTEETIDTELQDNIIELYSLQVQNFYKNRFYLRLLKYDRYTPLIIFIMVLVYVITIVLLSYTSPGFAGFI